MDQLTPTQQKLLQQLRRDGELVFDEGFVTHLTEQALAVVTDASERLGGEKLTVSKGWLSMVLGCEVKHVADLPFSWSPATAKGFVAHKAIELAANWRGEPVPSELVDEAIARFADQGTYRGDFIASLGEGDIAELRSLAVDRVTSFLQDFPPLPARSQPVFEASTRWTPPGTVQLMGRTDLVIGRPEGRSSTKLIIDFKTGWRNGHHRDDLRFYALLETLVRAVPPRRLVTYYLDSCEADVEDVTEGMLESALARLAGALDRHLELTEGREPDHRPSGLCRWCALLPGCDVGRTHLSALDDDGTQGFD
ncbi:MAG: PD-(D/E)XK nuclease family protein [Ilumatobacteraceae bacterium]